MAIPEFDKGELQREFEKRAKHYIENQKDLNYGITGENEKISRLDTVHTIRDQDNPKQQKKKEKDRQKLRKMLEEVREGLMKQLALLQEQLDGLIEERDQLYRQKDALNCLIDKLERGEKIELGRDGYPLDKDARAAIQNYEQSTGRKFGDDDSLVFLYDTRTEVQSEIEKTDREIEKTKIEIDKTSRDLEDINERLENGDYNEEYVFRVQQLEKAYESQSQEPENESTLAKPTSPPLTLKF